MQLKYGTNPHQRFASAEPLDPAHVPVRLVHGTPSMINLLDALNGWQLVRELRAALGLPAAASFKHVSPAGAAVAAPLDATLERVYGVDGNALSPAATAYVRARCADPKSSYGDFVAISDPVDAATAGFLKGVVSDGIIAPGYEPAALNVLKEKKSATFIILEADAAYEPPLREAREIFGMKLLQDRNDHRIGSEDLRNVKVGTLTADAKRDLVLGLVTLKYTQSNSVGYAYGGQMIGIGAGQQSRVDCTKLAGQKADLWHLGRHPKVLGLEFRPGIRNQDRINWRVRYIDGDLTREEERGLEAALARPAEPLAEAEKRAFLATITDVSLVSDGFIPFRDNIDHASKHGVRFIAEPGGSSRDADVEAACREYGIALVYTGVRLFHH
jgi:phosphoribosylaminoimidazolecarboxamide formyltransferase/IMP cyclohydrolase